MFKWKRNPKESAPGSSEAEKNFDRAASQVVADKPAPTPEAVAGVERFLISDAWARSAVKGCFWPMQKYSHPAWALTDDEAEKARPEMQKFLQAVFDRYIPQTLSALYLRHPELFALLYAMATLAWYKAKLVNEAVASEVEGPPASVEDAPHE